MHEKAPDTKLRIKRFISFIIFCLDVILSVFPCTDMCIFYSTKTFEIVYKQIDKQYKLYYYIETILYRCSASFSRRFSPKTSIFNVHSVLLG